MRAILTTLTLIAMLGCAGNKPAATPNEALTEPGQRDALGFWVRLTFDDEIDTLMWDQLEEAGTTDLFVETFYHGLVIYPESNLFTQRPELEGTDPLRVAIDEAHARGIRLHAWIECYYWGPDYERFPQIPRSPLADMAVENDWICRTVDGRTADRVYVSPAVPQVKDTVARLCLDICQRYSDIDGINLDYIRWPAPSEAGGPAWYDEVNIASHLAAGNPDPRVDTGDENTARFREHSANHVTETVRTIATAVHGLWPNVMITAAFFPSIDSPDAFAKAQDWRRWLTEGLLDVATPMCYAMSIEGLEREVETISQWAQGTGVPVWAGLSVHEGTGHPGAVEQFEAISGRGLSGAVIFSHGWVAEHPEEFAEMGAWLAENGF